MFGPWTCSRENSLISHIFNSSTINYALKNEHPKDACYDEIGLCAQINDIILDPNSNFMRFFKEKENILFLHVIAIAFEHCI